MVVTKIDIPSQISFLNLVAFLPHVFIIYLFGQSSAYFVCERGLPVAAKELWGNEDVN